MFRNLFAVFAIAAGIVTNAFGHQDQSKHARGDHSKAGEPVYGRPADPAVADRTIVVEMRDSFEFSPSEITVRTGEIVRFVPTNTGKHEHEMVLGTMKDLTEHYEAMKADPGMRHTEPNMARVAPGKAGVIAWQFTHPGEFYFACLVDDHFDAGMIGKIRVVGEPVAAEAGHDHAHPEHGQHEHPSETLGALGGY